MIKLGYLQDYNSFNVPSFNSERDRDEYFDNIVVYEIDAYYPPYFTNTIKLSIDEVPTTSPINFVILVHNDKYYYYFIDKQHYTNEEIYSIDISMDSVLTYMYNFKVTNGIITRKSIARWNGTVINRNYIRENVSEGFMEITDYDMKSPNAYVVVCSSKNYCDSSIAPPNIQRGYNTFQMPYYVYVIPLPPKELLTSADIVYLTTNSETSLSCNNQNLISKFAKDAYTLNMYYLESEYLDDMLSPEWSADDIVTANLTINNYISTLRIIDFDDNNNYSLGLMIPLYNVEPITTDTINFNFLSNTTYGTDFDIKYIPQLLDENYIQVEYGDVTGFSSYPLHLSNTANLYAKNTLDVATGNISYYITDIVNDDNRYKTNIVALPVTFDLINDAWNEYYARNKASLTTGLQLQAVNTLYSTMQGLARVGSGAGASFTSMTRAYTNVEKNTTSLTAKDTMTMPSGSLTPISDGLMSGINIIANYQITRDNLQYTPDTIKGRGDVYSMLMTEYKTPYIKKYKVSDIVACGKKLEEYGYKVNEVYNTASYINEISNIRHYYNCLSINITAFSIECLIPYEYINDIMERMKNGVRIINMSNVTTTISDVFKLDNTEEV